MKFFNLICVCLLLHYSILAQKLSGHITLSNQEFKILDILGVADLHNLKVDDLIILGSLNFNKLNAKNLSIQGSLNGNIGNFGKIDVKGAANLKNITANSLNILSGKNKSKISISNSTIYSNASLETSSVKIMNSVFNKLTIDAEKIDLTDIKVTNLIIDTKKNATVHILDTTNNTTDIKSIKFKHKGSNLIILPKQFHDNYHNIIKMIIGAKIKYQEN